MTRTIVNSDNGRKRSTDITNGVWAFLLVHCCIGRSSGEVPTHAVDQARQQRSEAKRWLELDNNPNTVSITVGSGPGGDSLYQQHADGSVWVFTGVPMTGWTRLDNDVRTVQVVAGGGSLYQRHKLGSIWTFTGAI